MPGIVVLILISVALMFVIILGLRPYLLSLDKKEEERRRFAEARQLEREALEKNRRRIIGTIESELNLASTEREISGDWRTLLSWGHKPDNGGALMASSMEVLKEVEEEVSKALKLFRENNTGANIEEAKSLLRDTATAVGRDQFGEALSLAKKAQLAANPTTEYLLGRAKGLEGQGNAAYQNQDYSRAVESWKACMAEYGRVRELAVRRGEQDIVRRIAENTSSIEADIKSAILAKASRDVAAVVSQANEMVAEAKRQYSSGRFDEAAQGFQLARQNYSAALDLAAKSGLPDEPSLRETLAGIQESVENCYLGRANQMLEAADSRTGAEREKACSQVADFLKTFTSSSPLYARLQKAADGGIARGRIEVGTEMMQHAEELFQKPDVYEAKETYRKAYEHFSHVGDYAAQRGLEDEKRQSDRQMQLCLDGVRTCSDVEMGIRKPLGAERQPPSVTPEDPRTTPPNLSGPTDRENTDRLRRELLHEYSAVTWLATGGANYVFRAQDHYGADIILRMPKNIDRARAKTFLDEFKAWDNLHHRNIVRLIEAVVAPPPIRLELEYVAGGSLKDSLALARADGRIACRIANDVARGLDYAHSVGVIHGDIKPSNILLTPNGEAKITDWSIGISATPGYAAPEQIENRIADEKTDIYQMGMVFYEMLCGNNPLSHGADWEKEKMTLAWVPERPSTQDSRFKPLDEICLGCLAKEAKLRPSIREFREATYQFMKQSYGESLSLSRGPGERAVVLMDQAISAVKNGRYDEMKGILEALARDLSGDKRQGQIILNINNINQFTDTVVYKSPIGAPQSEAGKAETQDVVVSQLMQMLAPLKTS